MKVLGKNKGALYNYEIVKKYEAGIALKGWEVKSIKNSMFNLKDSFIVIRKGELYITGMHISRWKTQSKDIALDNFRERKLLLKRGEIKRLELEKQRLANSTIVPLKVYLKGNRIKIEIALVRGKKKYEKRQALKEKEAKKDIQSKNLNVW